MQKIKLLFFLTIVVTLLTCVLASASFAGAAVELNDLDFDRVHPGVRIKDIVDIGGARPNQLSGIGIVTGLAGTGDRSPMTRQMMRNLLKQVGVSVDEKSIRSRNAAVVMVTAELPPYVRPGQTIDLNVSTMGDAKSLQGGTLLQTPLKAADGAVYAVAQGPVLIGGYAAQTLQTVRESAAAVNRNVASAGRIPGGAIVEREVPTDYAADGRVALLLRNPDFTTAQRIAEAVNVAFGRVAMPVDAGRVELAVPGAYASSPTAFISRLETLEVEPDAVARVAVNERTGTVVMGGDVKISAVAVAHGNLTVSVVAEDTLSVPLTPFAPLQAPAQARTDITVAEQGTSMIAMPATTTVRELVRVMNAIGASPRDIISILQAINEAGALHGQLVNM